MTAKHQSESIQQAIKWISSRREDADKRPLARLIEEAGQHFDLSPLDQEFLFGFFTGGRKESEP
ncbi:MAG: hypothetical protein JW884_13850 [Deltaproteobacteria bacterium]|nr:hypothetical protein [Deltaproteobacteria bacterium]